MGANCGAAPGARARRHVLLPRFNTSLRQDGDPQLSKDPYSSVPPYLSMSVQEHLSACQGAECMYSMVQRHGGGHAAGGEGLTVNR